MKLKIILFIFAANCLLSFGLKNNEISSFIIGGENATVEEYPFMAGVHYRGDHICGGAIITSRSVLTVHTQLKKIKIRI
jgi:secreted trypsin-like serine protease